MLGCLVLPMIILLFLEVNKIAPHKPLQWVRVFPKQCESGAQGAERKEGGGKVSYNELPLS